MKRRGLIVFPHELGDYWIRAARRARINVLGLHPADGAEAFGAIERLLHETVVSPSFRIAAGKLQKMGVALEYELHAMSWLLPRTEFTAHPEWFRMDRSGSRTADCNFCPSNEEALAYVERRAEELARALPFTTSHRYYFWQDDNCKKCHCPVCRDLNPSDQALLIYNRILRGVCRADPEGMVSFLAYQNTLELPGTIRPEPGVFFEYAPIDRDSDEPIGSPDSAKNRWQTSTLPAFLELFGRETAQVLEYWLDSPRRTNYIPPYPKLIYKDEVVREDVAYYASLGIPSMTTFACSLGEAYELEFGTAPFEAYGRTLLEEGGGEA